MNKKCYKCKKLLDYSLFHKNKAKKDGLSSECKSCKNKQGKNRVYDKEYMSKYYNDNRNKILSKVTDYYQKNKDKVKDYHKKYRIDNEDKLKEYSKKYREKTKTKYRKYFREYKKNRLKTDDLFKFKIAVRKRVNTAFRVSSWKKDSSNESMLKCSFKEAKEHIESMFTEGMSWDNYGRHGWHIDHIIPLCSAKTKEELYDLCNYKNLQPLWAKDNLSKGSNIITNSK